MAILVRKLDKKGWLRAEIAKELGGLQADALKNFKTTDNALSVYRLDGDIVPLDRILAALAGTRDHLQEIDYAMFDAELLKVHDIDTNDGPGETPDEEVNQRHLNLIKLTAPKLCALISSIQARGTVARAASKMVRNALLDSIHQARIKKDKLNARLIPRLEDEG